MKKVFIAAIAAIMALGSLTIVSCEKDNVVNPQSEQVATKNMNDRIQFPVPLQDFTASDGNTWTVWGGYYELLGRRGIKFDIKFFPTYSTSRVFIHHYVGTIEFELDGTYTINGVDFRLTPEIETFLHDFAVYYLQH